MNNIFQKTNAFWVRFSKYEYRQDENGILYLKPTSNAKPAVYDPMKEADALVVDALNVGRLAMKRGDEEELKQEILSFVSKYGLLGFMSALPTTVEFVVYDAVYLPKNHFIKEETLSTQEYLSYFFPFQKPDIHKSKNKAQWNVSEDNSGDRMMQALAMTFANEPMAMGMSLQRIYAERYDWLATQFRDWAFMLVSTFLYYEDKDHIDDVTRELYLQAVSAFGAKAPTYRIKLYDEKPAIVWDFYSLLVTIQTLFGFALADETRPLRVCKYCNQAFIAENTNAGFCSQGCKNKSRDNK